MKLTATKKIFFKLRLELLFFVIFGVIFLINISVAKALLGDYTKTSGDRLEASEWNMLLTDFVTKNNGGDALIGNYAINTAINPSYALDINGNLMIRPTGTSDTLQFLNLSTNGSRLLSSSYFAIETGGGEAIRFLSNGNIGIGTTAINNKLEIDGGTGNVIDVNGGRITGLNSVPLDDSEAVPLSYVRDNYSAISNSMWTGSLSGNISNVNSGNVGIGTTNPRTSLEIYNQYETTDPENVVLPGGTNSAIYGLMIKSNPDKNSSRPGIVQYGLRAPGGIAYSLQNVYIGSSEANAMKAGTFGIYGNVGASTHISSYLYMDARSTGAYNVATLKVDSNNRVGIALGGAYRPQSSLDVAGGVSIGSYGGYNAAPSNGMIISGNVGIGTINPSSKLTISGGDFEMDHNTSIKISSSTANTTLLFGNYADSLSFSYGTSTNANNKTVSLAVEGDVKANRFCIAEDCKDTWTEIVIAGGGSSIYVGATEKTTGSNNGVPGYQEAYRLCAEVVAGSHVCTPDDMLNTIFLGTTMPSEDVWVFAGPPGFTALANDCDGRTSSSNSGPLGTYWEVTNPSFPNGGHGLTSPCGANLKIACCK